jgi:hypothetical protein
VLVALWHPQLVYAGYFLSEPWFAAALALHAVLATRASERRAALFGIGMVSALAFVIRPQFLLTWMLETGDRLWARFRRGGAAPALRVLGWLASPVVLAVAISSVRLHRLSGQWGLISENANVGRFFADTDACEVRASWVPPGGSSVNYWFSPPSRPVRKPSDVVEYEGYIADPDILRSIARKRMRGATLRQRIARHAGNIALLAARNRPWPESTATEPWRKALHEWFAAATLFVALPLCWLGIVLAPKNRTTLVVAANLVTPIFVAAFYFGEARYRVPYDSFVLLLAVVGVVEGSRRAATLIHRRNGTADAAARAGR